MAPVTEIALLPLIEGKYPDDANSAPGQILKECLDVLLAQKGVQKCYWGREVENPSMMRLLIDWDSIDAHKAFISSDHSADTRDTIYKSFLERFSTLWSGDPVLFHARFAPNPPSVALKDIHSLATEIIAIYFPPSYSLEDQKTFEDNMAKLIAVFEKHSDGYSSFTGGWVDEELTIPGSSEKAKVYVGCVGWKSVEAHTLFTETPPFKDNIHLLSDSKDHKTYNLIHVHFNKVQLGNSDVVDA